MNERYVAAIEISSSKIIAVVGRTRPNGQLDVLAAEQEKGVEGVRYGVIHNLEETSMRIARILERLKRKTNVAPREIRSLFVGLAGRSLRTISTEVSLNLPEETEITEDILARLHHQALAMSIDSSLEVVDAIPRTYMVGKNVTQSPKGAVGNHISATFDLVVCRPELRRNIQRTLPEKIGIRIEAFVVTPLSTAQVILTPEQKRLGCMLVDMGSETTTVSIYKDGYLRYLATLPMGGRNITRDITSLSMLEERAEEMKITTGNALPRETAPSYSMGGIRMSEVSNLIVARSEEIVANIVEQISYAGLKENSLPAGIILIGGGAKLNGMSELLATQSGMNVQRGILPPYIHVEETKMPAADLIEVASILYSGAMHSDAECLEMTGPEDLPPTGEGNPDEPQNTAKEETPKKKGRFGMFKQRLASIFSGDEIDNSDLIE